MPVPEGLQGVTVTVGPLYAVTGDPIEGLPVKATLDAQVRVTNSGALLPSTSSTTTDATGAASLTFVASDSTGLDTTGFTYNIYVPGLTPPAGVNVLLNAANPTVRLEGLTPVTQASGAVLWTSSDLTDDQIDAIVADPVSNTRVRLDALYANTGAITSVDGRTGVVTLGDLYDPIGAGAAAVATHAASADHDGRYYTGVEVNNLLEGKAGAQHASQHAVGGTDVLDVATLSSGAAGVQYVPLADGAGGIAWGPSVVQDDARFQSGKVRRIIVWDKTAQTWGTIAPLPSWARANWWQSTNDPNAPTPPQASWVEDDWWDRADGAPWPLP